MNNGDGDDEKTEPDTMRVCGACGAGDAKFDCGWCHLGFQTERQYTAWKEWRIMQRTTSATHSVLEGICVNVVKQLRDSGMPGALTRALHGDDLVEAWRLAEDGEDRAKAASALLDFHRSSLEFLTRR